MGRAREGPTVLTPHCREKPRAPSEVAGDRSANRHRWAGREGSGERDNPRQGTRQVDPVTSGEGVPR